MYFTYGETEVSYLRQKDKRLGEVMDRIGHIDRAVDTDLFSSVIHHIVGQQISTKAQTTIWQRMQDTLGSINAETILAAGVSKLQGLGMTFRKAAHGRLLRTVQNVQPRRTCRQLSHCVQSEDRRPDVTHRRGSRRSLA